VPPVGARDAGQRLAPALHRAAPHPSAPVPNPPRLHPLPPEQCVAGALPPYRPSCSCCFLNFAVKGLAPIYLFFPNKIFRPMASRLLRSFIRPCRWVQSPPNSSTWQPDQYRSRVLVVQFVAGPHILIQILVNLVQKPPDTIQKKPFQALGKFAGVDSGGGALVYTSTCPGKDPCPSRPSVQVPSALAGAAAGAAGGGGRCGRTREARERNPGRGGAVRRRGRRAHGAGGRRAARVCAWRGRSLPRLAHAQGCRVEQARRTCERCSSAAAASMAFRAACPTAWGAWAGGARRTWTTSLSTPRSASSPTQATARSRRRTGKWP